LDKQASFSRTTARPGYLAKRQRWHVRATWLPLLLEKAEKAKAESIVNDYPTKWDKLDTYHYTIWSESRESHRQHTREMALYRKESLAKSHQARIALLTEQLNQATDEKIKRMRHSQIESAEADYARRIQELEIATERADIIAEPVAFGIIEITGGAPNAL